MSLTNSERGKCLAQPEQHVFASDVGSMLATKDVANYHFGRCVSSHMPRCASESMGSHMLCCASESVGSHMLRCINLLGDEQVCPRESEVHCLLCLLV